MSAEHSRAKTRRRKAKQAAEFERLIDAGKATPKRVITPNIWAQIWVIAVSIGSGNAMKLFMLLLFGSVTLLFAGSIVPAGKAFYGLAQTKHPVRRFGDQVEDFREWFASAQKELVREKKGEKKVTGPADCFLLSGKILQVVGGGLLVDVTDSGLDIEGRPWREATKTVMLENYPQTLEAFDGKTVFCVVKASGRYQYRNVSGSESTVEKYNYGVPLSQQEIDQRDRDIIAATRVRSEAIARADRERFKAMTPGIVVYQLKQASNGYPSFQLELGKRYMRGDGVETNLALALHWLQAACTNGESQASNLLMQLKSNGTK